MPVSAIGVAPHFGLWTSFEEGRVRNLGYRRRPTLSFKLQVTTIYLGQGSAGILCGVNDNPVPYDRTISTKVPLGLLHTCIKVPRGMTTRLKRLSGFCFWERLKQARRWEWKVLEGM